MHLEAKRERESDFILLSTTKLNPIISLRDTSATRAWKEEEKPNPSRLRNGRLLRYSRQRKLEAFPQGFDRLALWISWAWVYLRLSSS